MAVLDAAASVTSRLRLGTLVASNDFRHPLVLAKEAATVDVISAGRLELSLGTGWDGSDYAEPGIALAGPAERIDLLAEAIAVLKAAFSGERFSFTGQHYQVRGHAAGPVPAQRPHPPLMKAIVTGAAAACIAVSSSPCVSRPQCRDEPDRRRAGPFRAAHQPRGLLLGGGARPGLYVACSLMAGARPTAPGRGCRRR